MFVTSSWYQKKRVQIRETFIFPIHSPNPFSQSTFFPNLFLKRYIIRKGFFHLHKPQIRIHNQAHPSSPIKKRSSFPSMSIVAFKKKSVIQHGSNRSGKPPGGYWLPQGPFGKYTTSLQEAIENPGPVGFSLNGSHRNVGYVGKSMHMSKNGTPFRGLYPLGNGGSGGTYITPLPTFNVNEVYVLGEQNAYIKPTVLTNYGMLSKKYRWIKTGKYPNYWVQPVFSGGNGTTQSDTASQGMYIHNLIADNMCVEDINNSAKYEDHIKHCGPTLCQTSTSRFKYNDMARNGPYVKIIGQPLDQSQQIMRIQRKCTNPKGPQKPFPYATNGGECNAAPPVYSPPEWYINS